MAEVVVGIGMSHSPMVVAEDTDLWLALGKADRHSPYLRDASGAEIAFAELELRNGDRYAEQAAPEHLAAQLEETRLAVRRLKEVFAAAEPDVAVVLGDDQLELFDLANMPALGVYYGERVVMATRTRFRDYRAIGFDPALYTRGVGMDAAHVWPGHAPLGEHLIVSTIEQGFDVAAVREASSNGDGGGLGHAFGIVAVQLMDDEKLPFVPVFVNDYWSPNQVSPARCYAFGRALRHAIDTFPAELRVAVVATGGLSHFVTNEELDRHVLDALCAGDADALTALPAARLNSGNSEIRNWIALAAACEDKAVTPEAYIPVYRTAAGTGCGLAFATWS